MHDHKYCVLAVVFVHQIDNAGIHIKRAGRRVVIISKEDRYHWKAPSRLLDFWKDRNLYFLFIFLTCSIIDDGKREEKQ